MLLPLADKTIARMNSQVMVGNGGSVPLKARSRLARARMRKPLPLTNILRQPTIRVIKPPTMLSYASFSLKPTMAQPQPSPPPSPSSAAHSVKPQSPQPPVVAGTSSSNILRGFIANTKQLDWDCGAASCMSRDAHITVEQTIVENIEQFTEGAIKYGENKGSAHTRRMALANAAQTAQLLHKSQQTGGLVPPKRKPPSLQSRPVTHARLSERQIKPPLANDDTVPVPITLQRDGSQIARTLRRMSSSAQDAAQDAARAAAATKLSATYRGMRHRKELGKQQAAAVKLSSAFRGKAARTSFKEFRAKVTADELKRKNASFWHKLRETMREEHTLVNFIAPSETEEGLTPAQVVQIFWTMLAFE